MKTDLEGLQAAQHKVGILLGAGDGGKEKGGGKKSLKKRVHPPKSAPLQQQKMGSRAGKGGSQP